MSAYILYTKWNQKKKKSLKIRSVRQINDDKLRYTCLVSLYLVVSYKNRLVYRQTIGLHHVWIRTYRSSSLYGWLSALCSQRVKCKIYAKRRGNCNDDYLCSYLCLSYTLPYYYNNSREIESERDKRDRENIRYIYLPVCGLWMCVT